MVAAGEAIHEHIGELAKDLTSIMRTQVLAPFRSSQHTAEEARAFDATVARLRQLTIEAVVTEFQRTANDLLPGSLLRTQVHSGASCHSTCAVVGRERPPTSGAASAPGVVAADRATGAAADQAPGGLAPPRRQE